MLLMKLSNEVVKTVLNNQVRLPAAAAAAKQ
jgi:hypothetical protein